MSPNQQLTPWLPILPEVGTSPRRKLNVDMREWGNGLCLDWLFKGHKREMKRKELRLISSFLGNELEPLHHGTFFRYDWLLGLSQFLFRNTYFQEHWISKLHTPKCNVHTNKHSPNSWELSPLSDEQDYFLSASTNLFNCMLFIFYLCVFWRPLTELLVCYLGHLF